MMERKFVQEKIKEFQVQEFLEEKMNNVGHSHTQLRRTPVGEKVIIFANRPGLIVGRKGGNIKDLTKDLKEKFGLENPQIEIREVKNIYQNPQIVAEKIASSLERFGAGRFKGVGHKMIEKIMESGALGVEILISGKIPGARARTWRFYQGYLKKCGDVAVEGVKKAYKKALLKIGIVGIQVRIMPSDVHLPDKFDIRDEVVEEAADVVDDKSSKSVSKTDGKAPAKKKTTRKTTTKKATPKKATTKKTPAKKKAEEKPSEEKSE